MLSQTHTKKRNADEYEVSQSSGPSLALSTHAYGNNAVTHLKHKTIAEAIAANDPFSATILYLTSKSHINLDYDQITYLSPTCAYNALEAWGKGNKICVSVPITEGDQYINAFFYVAQNTSSISEISIHAKGAKTADIIKSIKTISAIKSIERLVLTGNPITTNDIAKALSDLLRENTSLKKLTVYWNMSETLKILIDAVQENKTLKDLRIERPEALYTHIEEKSNPSLKADDLCSFAKMLEGNTSITSVSLKGCNIPDNVAEAFAHALKMNNTVESINLSECLISKEGLKLISDTLLEKGSLGALRSMTLTGNDPAGAAYLSDIKSKYSNIEIYYDAFTVSGTAGRCCGKREYKPLPKPVANLNTPKI